MNYTNREVVRRLKQYDMFLNSMNLATDEVQKERICDQLDKIEKQILLETNTEYEEKYMLLLGEDAKFFSEEKTRLHNLISLVMDRKKYLEDRKNKHKEITGSLVELTTFLGEDQLNSFKKRLEIIEKYEENKVRQENIIKEMKSLDIKLSEASRIVKANTRLNDIMENKMREVVSKALDKFSLYALTSKKDEILKGYETYQYAFNMAKDNLKSAKKLNDETMIMNCDEMLSQITSEYSKYSEKVNILELIDIYDNSVTGYDELFLKREKMSEILKNISDSLLYSEIADELNKQYNTIKLEKKDIENYEALKQDREYKNRTLYEIDEENNSKEFKAVIDELVKNEKRVREEKIRKAKNEEYQERQKKLLEEQKIEASRVRRQKLIEEARLKEQRERFENLKELQNKTVIAPREDKDEEDREFKINNPLKDKTFEETVLSNNFDTDELFENTKIVPNRASITEMTFKEVEDKPIYKEEVSVIEESDNTLDEIRQEVLEDSQDNYSDDLFKEEDTSLEIKVSEPNIKLEKEIKKDKPSIYDILENNQNIIWKTTDTNINDTIPVIGNNNLRPERINKNDTVFPELNNGKEGEILWKETL